MGFWFSPSVALKCENRKHGTLISEYNRSLLKKESRLNVQTSYTLAVWPKGRKGDHCLLEKIIESILSNKNHVYIQYKVNAIRYKC